MSVPVSICLIARAAGSESAYQRVLERLKYNAECGAFSLWPCTHYPKCKLPEMNAAVALIKRLRGDLAATQQGPVNAVLDKLEHEYAAPPGPGAMQIEGTSGPHLP